MKAIFISDIHLRDINESNSKELLLFFSKAAQDKNLTHIFMVGDIFDLWIGNSSFFKKKYAPLLAAINKCAQVCTIHYFEGNHDLYLKKYWQKELGVKVHPGPEVFSLGPWKVRVEHGDEMNPEDRGYLWLRWFLRICWVRAFIQCLPGALVHFIGNGASAISEKNHEPWSPQLKEKIIGFTRAHGRKFGVTDQVDWVISGHTHVQDFFKFQENGRTWRSVNLGSWHKGPVYFCLDERTGQFLNTVP